MDAVETKYDEAIAVIADYVADATIESHEAYQTAALCLADTLGCAVLALQFDACTKLLGPIVPGTVVPNGCRVPGSSFILDPVAAAFNITTMARWLDYNDTWLAAEWGHPSDNLGGLLAVSDYCGRLGEALTVGDLLTAMIKAYEIQGGLAMLNSFNRIGFDHVILVKVATAAVATRLLGGNRQQIADSISNAWIDVGPLRTYRHAPSTGSRKSWAAGDATSRGVFLSLMTMRGEMGYPQALSAPRWGFYDVLFEGKPFQFQMPLQSYVMENVLFKIAYPAEFHAQTAVEAAIRLHPSIDGRIESIKKIEISTHESALRIIDKKGPLYNPADRDHCLQYMVAIALLRGQLTAKDYEDQTAADPRIDTLREKMDIVENSAYSRDYLDPSKRSIASALTIYFDDDSISETVEVEYPLGHRRRREEAVPLLFEKFRQNMLTRFDQERVNKLEAIFRDQQTLENMLITRFMELLV